MNTDWESKCPDMFWKAIVWIKGECVGYYPLNVKVRAAERIIQLRFAELIMQIFSSTNSAELIRQLAFFSLATGNHDSAELVMLKEKLQTKSIRPFNQV